MVWALFWQPWRPIQSKWCHFIFTIQHAAEVTPFSRHFVLAADRLFSLLYNVVPLSGSLCQAVVWTAIANQSSGWLLSILILLFACCGCCLAWLILLFHYVPSSGLPGQDVVCRLIITHPVDIVWFYRILGSSNTWLAGPGLAHWAESTWLTSLQGFCLPKLLEISHSWYIFAQITNGVIV